MHHASGMTAIVLIVLALAPAAWAEQTLSVSVPGKTIELSQGEWIKMTDETGFAKNFEERKQAPWHEFRRVVTVYLIPMSADRRLGLKISENEYVEFFIVHPGFVTVQTRVDKGKYWVLCRETFKPKAPLPLDISTYDPFLTREENHQLWEHYQAEVDETRYLLNSRF